VRVLTPESVETACAMMAAENATPIAGGTDLLVHWPENLAARDQTYVDLTGLAHEIRQIRWSDDHFIIGGLTTYWDVLRVDQVWDEFPLLIEAGRQVGAVQIQARGTWAGNIVNASPAADGVPVLMAYDAEIELTSTAGVERGRLDEFYSGYKQMKRRADQLITSIMIPRRTYDFQRFDKVGARRAQAITKIGLATAHSEAGWRVVANSMDATIKRCPACEALFEAGRATKAQILDAVRADVSPIDDIRSTAEYRINVMVNLVEDLLRESGDKQ